MLVDIAVFSVLAMVAGFPVLDAAIRKVLAVSKKKDVANPDAVEQWRQRWTALLITLGREIESGSGGTIRKEEALRLSRELMWEIIGGEPDQPAKP